MHTYFSTIFHNYTSTSKTRGHYSFARAALTKFFTTLKRFKMKKIFGKNPTFFLLENFVFFCPIRRQNGGNCLGGVGGGEFLVQGFLGVLFKALGIFVGLIFASIQSSLSLGIKSTPLGSRCVINTHHLRHLLRLPFLP